MAPMEAAEEIGVSLPDPSVPNRGLRRLVRKVLEGNKDLSFKCTVPTRSTVVSTARQLVRTQKNQSWQGESQEDCCAALEEEDEKEARPGRRGCLDKSPD